MRPADGEPREQQRVQPRHLGAAAYLLSSTHGGARSAEEVAVQTSSSASEAAGANVPHCAACGSSRNAMHESAVAPRMNGPTRPSTRAGAVRGHAHHDVHHHEDQLIEHQDVDGVAPRQARRLEQPGQEDHVDRPAGDEQELDDGEIDAPRRAGAAAPPASHGACRSGTYGRASPMNHRRRLRPCVEGTTPCGRPRRGPDPSAVHRIKY